MEISDKLKTARVNAGVTQEQIAETIGVSRQTISNWENGRTLPDVMSLIKISDMYQISLDDLLKGDGKMVEKIKKDTDTVKSNRTMMRFGWGLLIAAFIFSIWCENGYDTGGQITQFIVAAAPWVMMGVGVACIAASISNQKKNGPF